MEQEGKRRIIIPDPTSPQGLISFSSLFSLTHSRQLIILLFPQIPQCTCNYHAHACLPPASCLEGGVSLSFSLGVPLSLLPLFSASLFFLSVTCHFLSPLFVSTFLFCHCFGFSPLSCTHSSSLLALFSFFHLCVFSFYIKPHIKIDSVRPQSHQNLLIKFN